MPANETEEFSPDHLLVALALIVPVIVLMVVITWVFYSPFTYNEQYTKMASVDISGLLPEGNVTITTAPATPMGGLSPALFLHDTGFHKWYQVRVVEQADYGPILPIPPKESFNYSASNGPITIPFFAINPCTRSRLIILTDTSYLIREFNQTMVCG